MRMWGSTDERVPMMPRNRWRRLDGGRDVMIDDIAAFVYCIENDRPSPDHRPRGRPARRDTHGRLHFSRPKRRSEASDSPNHELNDITLSH